MSVLVCATVPSVTDDSQVPLNVTGAQPWTAQQLSLLNIEQSLEDTVYFAQNFRLPANSSVVGKLPSPDALTAAKTPWIFLGFQDSAARAAQLRVRNPETIFAAWAASAPVQGQVDLPGYYTAIRRAMPTNCSADWAAATKYVDDALTGTNRTLADSVKYELYKASKIVGGATYSQESGGPTMDEVDQWDDASIASVLTMPFVFYRV
jgi:hypothetical protein